MAAAEQHSGSGTAAEQQAHLVSEAAEIVGIPERTLRAWIGRGRCPFSRRPRAAAASESPRGPSTSCARRSRSPGMGNGSSAAQRPQQHRSKPASRQTSSSTAGACRQRSGTAAVR